MGKKPARTVAVVAGIVMLALTAGAWWFRPIAPGGRVIWQAKQGGDPPSPRFMLALFPSSTAPIQHDEQIAQPLDRAILLSWSEWQDGPPFHYFRGTSDVTIERTGLSPWEPDAAKRPQYLDRLQSAFTSWGTDTDWKSCSLTGATTPNGDIEITLRLDHKDGDHDWFIYRVHPDQSIEPIQWRDGRPNAR